MFSSFNRDGARAEAPDALEVLHGEQSKRDVGADDQHGDDDGTPDMEVERPEEHGLAEERSTDPEHPARDRQGGNHAHEQEVGSLLTAVVATLRRNFNRTQRDLEEATGITTEVAEPHDRVAVPFQAGAKNKSKTIGSKHDKAEKVKREHYTKDKVSEHRSFSGASFGVAEISINARKEQSEPRDSVHRVEHLVGGVETKNTVISHGVPPSWTRASYAGNSEYGAIRAWCDRSA